MKKQVLALLLTVAGLLALVVHAAASPGLAPVGRLLQQAGRVYQMAGQWEFNGSAGGTALANPIPPRSTFTPSGRVIVGGSGEKAIRSQPRRIRFAIGAGSAPPSNSN